VGSGPEALCYNPHDNKVYCANDWGDSVTVIDGSSNQVVATLAVGSGPSALCYGVQNNKVYCANSYNSGTVTVIDGSSNQVIATVASGSSPSALCYSPQSNRVFCANQQDDSVVVISGESDSVLTMIAVGAGPLAMAYNPLHNRLYVANQWSKSISVIRDSVLGLAERPLPVGRRVVLEVSPNPFSDQIRLQLTASGSRPAVRVYDVNGALIRDLTKFEVRTSKFEGPRFLTWDGTDNAGRQLPNGVYLIRVSNGLHTLATKELVLARE
jgi:YVTN family beta-propeller protein